MSAFKGTPGPWEAGDDVILCADPDMIIGSVFPCDRDGTGFAYGEVTKANARLISAAPELLEACQTFVECLRREKEGLPVGIECDTPEGDRQWHTWWEEYLRIYDLAQQQAIAAIAKATGEQP